MPPTHSRQGQSRKITLELLYYRRLRTRFLYNVIKSYLTFLSNEFLKVRRRLSEIFAQAQAEIETLKKTENELRMGQSKLEDLGRRLDQEQVLIIWLLFIKLKSQRVLNV